MDWIFRFQDWLLVTILTPVLWRNKKNICTFWLDKIMGTLWNSSVVVIPLGPQERLSWRNKKNILTFCLENNNNKNKKKKQQQKTKQKNNNNNTKQQKKQKQQQHFLKLLLSLIFISSHFRTIPISAAIML